MADKAKLMKLERGRFSSPFQVARACLSAASALVSTDPKRAKRYLSEAIDELMRVSAELGG